MYDLLVDIKYWRVKRAVQVFVSKDDYQSVYNLGLLYTEKFISLLQKVDPLWPWKPHLRGIANFSRE